MQSVPDEKTALSGMPVVPTVVNGSGSSQPLGTPAEPVVTGAPAREPLLACPGDFRAALLVITPAVPLFATIAAVGIYVIPQSVVLAPFLDWVKPNALIAGVVVAVVGALLLAAIHCWVANGTAADHANSSAYSELVARFREIEARLGVVGERTNLSPSEQIAYRQVQSLSHMIHKELGTPGARWLLATGYVNLWALVHRAEEALLLVEPVEDVLRAADVFLEHGIVMESGPHKHAIQQTFFLYTWEPGGNRTEICSGGFLIFAPDHEAVVWSQAERAKGQAWGMQTVASFHIKGTPAVPEEDALLAGH